MSFNQGGGSASLSGATDIVFNSPATDQVLTYDATLVKWKNKAPTAGGAVSSVNTKTGTVVLTKADVGLGVVDNTTDLNKPISTATQAALNGKVATSSPNMRLDYGTALPAAGTPGRFFIVVPS